MPCLIQSCLYLIHARAYPSFLAEGPLAQGALVTFAAVDESVHGAVVTGIAVLDHGTRVDAWGKDVSLELNDFGAFG
jgi:hypothetical protein